MFFNNLSKMKTNQSDASKLLHGRTLQYSLGRFKCDRLHLQPMELKVFAEGFILKLGNATFLKKTRYFLSTITHLLAPTFRVQCCLAGTSRHAHMSKECQEITKNRRKKKFWPSNIQRCGRL